MQSDNNNNKNISANINFRLNHSNYKSWKKVTEAFLQQKILFHHIEYRDFDTYRSASYIPYTIKEKKYWSKKNEILITPITLMYRLADQEAELEKLETDFEAHFKNFEADRSKAYEKWRGEEQQIYGIFAGCIEDNIWQDAKCLRSSIDIWNHLKKATGQQTSSAWLSALNRFYNSTMRDGETLTNFVGRIIQLNNDIIEIGDNSILFSPLHVVAKIISSIPFNNIRFQPIVQSLYLMDRALLKIDHIKQLFLEEDMRINSNPRGNNNPNPNPNPKVNLAKEKDKGKKEPQNKDKNSSSDGKPRPCSVKECTKMVPGDSPSYFHQCSDCHKKRQEARGKDKDKKSEKASNVVLVLTANATESSSKKDDTLYLDSGATSHISNGAAFVRNLSDDSTPVMGPSGEVSKATGKANIVFDTNQGQYEFENALVVPNMDRNLLSVSKITGANDDIFVIFHKNKFEIFEGDISRSGKTHIQGELDKSGLYALSNSLDDNATSATEEVLSLASVVETMSRRDRNIALWNTRKRNLTCDSKSISIIPSSPSSPIIEPIFEKQESAISSNVSSPIIEPIIEKKCDQENIMEILINAIQKSPKRTLEEWHLALAHLSKKQLLRLANLGTIQIKNPTDSLSCFFCQSAKMKRKKFDKAMPPKADNIGEAIYSDVCGKISPKTLFGEEYFVTFIDEVSGYIFLYLIKKKSDVLDRFKEVLARVNNQNATTSVKIFISDGGGEYIGKEFQEVIIEKGIIHQKTPSNTPQRNGKSERLNKIIFDHTRAMLKAREMPRRFWGEAALYATYIINRTPIKGKNQARHEMLFGKKQTLEKTLEFGTPVFFHNHDPHIKKLHDRAFEGLFLGFWEDDHTYKIFDFKTNSLISTRTISSHPDHIQKFEDNDWNQGFEVEDDDNWITGVSDSPQYFPYADFILPPIKENEVSQEIIPNIPKEIDIDDDISQQISESEDESESDDGPPPNFQVYIPLKDQGPIHKALSVKEIDSVLNLAEIITPNTYKQAIYGKDADAWKKSIALEHASLYSNETFEVVDRPKDKKPITTRHVFKIKTDENGAISKYKTRLVARGYNQTYGENYFEVFSPTLRMDTIRFLISTAVQFKMKVHHLDVETAFLNGTLSEEIFLEIPEGFDQYDSKTKVFRLKKSIYGLKQASRVWNELFTSELVKMGLKQSDADPCVFLKSHEENGFMIIDALIGVFVDDCFVIGGDDQIKLYKDLLMNKFKMHDFGLLSFALGIKFDQKSDFSIQMSQSLYVDKVVEKFGMADSKIAATPLSLKSALPEESPIFEDVNKYQQLVGSLIYLSNSTRPDIAYAVSYLARSMHAPKEIDWISGKRVLRYLKGTRELALNYAEKDQELLIFSDSSYAEEKDYKSVGGYVSMQAGAAITWKSTKQSIVAQSSMEAEYIALAEAAKEVLWLRKLQKEIRPSQISFPTTIFEDNQSTIKLSKNPIHSNRSKHIAVRYHMIQDLVNDKTIHVEYKPTDQMVADIMTKSLGKVLHERFTASMGLVNLTSSEKIKKL